MKRTHPLSRLVLILGASASLAVGLSACAPLLVGGAAVGAGMVATDRRSSGAQVEDQTIELRGAARVREVATDTTNVTVFSYNRQVLLTGTVGSDAERRRVEEVVSKVDNVRGVFNEVTVSPGTTFGDRSNDLYITSKVKASLVNQKDIFANNFKVVTDRGVVYLLGIATQSELDQATQITRGVDGVAKVVRLVEVVPDTAVASNWSTGGSSSSSSSSSSSRVPLPPMAPLPTAGSSAGAASAAATESGVVVTPVR